MCISPLRYDNFYYWVNFIFPFMAYRMLFYHQSTDLMNFFMLLSKQTQYNYHSERVNVFSIRIFLFYFPWKHVSFPSSFSHF